MMRDIFFRYQTVLYSGLFGGFIPLLLIYILFVPCSSYAQKLEGTVKDCMQVSCADVPPPRTPVKVLQNTPDPLEQCVLLLFASFCFLISGGKPLAGLRWRKQGRHVQGTIVDVSKTAMSTRSGPITSYWPIYHFMIDGETYAGILDHAVLEKQPELYNLGSKADLLVFSSKPTIVRRADAPIFDGIDAAFLAIGGGLTCLAMTIHTAITPQFWMMFGVLCVVMLVQSCRVFVPDNGSPPITAIVTPDNRSAEAQLRPARELSAVVLCMISVPLLLFLIFNYFQSFRHWFENF
ncbi:MAG: hypothetical protein PSY14_04005 [bacterium]|nr:hypothetical protein [bacterium]